MDSRVQNELFKAQAEKHSKLGPGNIPWIIGEVETVVGKFPVIKTALESSDHAGTLRVRLGVGRHDYQVVPGLYAVGSPSPEAPVLVTANYKLSFDMLRKELAGINAWILVIDTKGVNVWCAAGKGTFGTDELAGRVNFLKLRRIVSHRTLILPQLSASGVKSYEVTKRTGFKVVFGPVQASDIPAFLAADMTATAEMRKVKFNILDRAILTPIEVMHSIKPLLFILAGLFILNMINPEPQSLPVSLWKTWLNLLPFIGAAFIGCILVPILLPWIPFHAFSLKGLVLGLLFGFAVFMLPGNFGLGTENWLLRWAYLVSLPAIVSYLALNFTGSTTYTSFSGVKKEMRLGLIPMIAACGTGIILAVLQKVLQFLG